MVFMAVIGGLVLLARTAQRSSGTRHHRNDTHPDPIANQWHYYYSHYAARFGLDARRHGVVYLSTIEATELPPYAVTSVVPDAAGQFVAMLTFPANVDSQTGRAIKVIAREIGRDVTTYAFYTLSDFGGQFTRHPPENRLYALTNSGLFLNTDAQWQKTDSLPVVPLSVAVAPGSPLRIYATNSLGGAYRSNDGGQTWETIGHELNVGPTLLLKITALVVDPENADHIIAATAYGFQPA